MPAPQGDARDKRRAGAILGLAFALGTPARIAGLTGLELPFPGRASCPLCAPVHCAAGSDAEMNFGVTSLAALKAASSSVARYSRTARHASGPSLSALHASPGVEGCLLASVHREPFAVFGDPVVASFLSFVFVAGGVDPESSEVRMSLGGFYRNFVCFKYTEILC